MPQAARDSARTAEQDFLYQRKYAVSSDGEDSPQGDISSGGMSNKNTEWTQNSYTWVRNGITLVSYGMRFAHYSTRQVEDVYTTALHRMCF